MESENNEGKRTPAKYRWLSECLCGCCSCGLDGKEEYGQVGVFIPRLLTAKHCLARTESIGYDDLSIA